MSIKFVDRGIFNSFLRFFYSTSDHDLKNIDKSVEMSCYGAVILMSFPFASLRTAMYCWSEEFQTHNKLLQNWILKAIMLS